MARIGRRPPSQRAHPAASWRASRVLAWTDPGIGRRRWRSGWRRGGVMAVAGSRRQHPRTTFAEWSGHEWTGIATAVGPTGTAGG
jgi:hypothetical protein